MSEPKEPLVFTLGPTPADDLINVIKANSGSNELNNQDVITTLQVAEGNVGAASALANVFRQLPEIDSEGSPQEVLNTLFEIGITGAWLWVLYKDKCHEDAETFLTVIKAAQFGILKPHQFSYNPGIRDIPALSQTVIGTTARLIHMRFPNFGRK